MRNELRAKFGVVALASLLMVGCSPSSPSSSPDHTNKAASAALPLPPKPQRVKDSCKKNWSANKANCSGFVKAVSNDLHAYSFDDSPQADDMMSKIEGDASWTKLADSIKAKEAADEGWFVIAGLKGNDHTPKKNNGHIVVVVEGPLDNTYKKYAHGYWGQLDGTGKEDTTVNYAWLKADIDNVKYYKREFK